jgi:hypothetical protein
MCACGVQLSCANPEYLAPGTRKEWRSNGRSRKSGVGIFVQEVLLLIVGLVLYLSMADNFNKVGLLNSSENQCRK